MGNNPIMMHHLKYFFVFPFILTVFVACGNKQTNNPTTDTPGDSLSQNGSIPAPDTLTEVQDTVPVTYDGEIGIFKDAVFYTGATYFVFDINGKEEKIRVDNYIYLDIEDGKTVKGYEIQPDLLATDGDPDELPGGNPKWIGKKFEVLQSDTLLRILPIEEPNQ